MRFGLKLLAGAMLAAAAFVTAADARTIRWARSVDAQTLDPMSANIGPTSNLVHQIYEPLVIRGYDGKLVATLATEWRILPDDPTVWEFKLRQGVKFHNGTAFTADDAIFSFERARKPTSDYRGLLTSIESVTKVDDHTIRIKTRAPNPLLVENLTNIFMMSKAWSEANNAADPQNIRERAENGATRNAMGTGPFTLVSREPDVRTVMRQFADYWGKGQFPMQVTELIVVPIQQDATRIAALLSGEVDVVHDVPVQDIARLQQSQGIRVTSGPENRVIFLGFNVGDAELKSSDIKGRNPFADVRVRNAINVSINREAITRVVMRGQGQPIGYIGSPFISGYSAELAAIPRFDPAAANRALDEAGYPRRASEGNTRFSVTLQCTNNRYVSDENICQAVVTMLGQIGIRTNMVAKPAAQHFPELQRQELDFYLVGWGIPTYDAEYVLTFLYHTRTANNGTWNGTRYSNPSLDARMLALQTMPDIAKRNAELADIQKQLRDQAIYIPLHLQSISHASRGGIEVPVHPDAGAWFKLFRFAGS
ncbi:ABC transporter substrate-binding protein [Phreatobacter oligotrophus]|uniref:Peptide/nickel transport system substrate-binding protein n=1 Tax=Phreatobacter oligotrophus TaxID=1122261 RepID=A0A2T4Z3A0_9HYPH|nr:ABC transporter substrate-binding protein [Phreatobacter oligotrophus]PTM55250.1 peptide/nickel transport system substrate-binding protein [Phreatobacter oligotrophus]